jgi:hypothetical protein
MIPQPFPALQTKPQPGAIRIPASNPKTSYSLSLEVWGTADGVYLRHIYDVGQGELVGAACQLLTLDALNQLCAALTQCRDVWQQTQPRGTSHVND